jgi:hypothetical protein
MVRMFLQRIIWKKPSKEKNYGKATEREFGNILGISWLYTICRGYSVPNDKLWKWMPLIKPETMIFISKYINT